MSQYHSMWRDIYAIFFFFVFSAGMRNDGENCSGKIIQYKFLKQRTQRRWVIKCGYEIQREFLMSINDHLKPHLIVNNRRVQNIFNVNIMKIGFSRPPCSLFTSSIFKMDPKSTRATIWQRSNVSFFFFCSNRYT